jgi:hypothetical protein
MLFMSEFLHHRETILQFHCFLGSNSVTAHPLVRSRIELQIASKCQHFCQLLCLTLETFRRLGSPDVTTGPVCGPGKFRRLIVIGNSARLLWVSRGLEVLDYLLYAKYILKH